VLKQNDKLGLCGHRSSRHGGSGGSLTSLIKIGAKGRQLRALSRVSDGRDRNPADILRLIEELRPRVVSKAFECRAVSGTHRVSATLDVIDPPRPFWLAGNMAMAEIRDMAHGHRTNVAYSEAPFRKPDAD
jgi:hypothetical protein